MPRRFCTAPGCYEVFTASATGTSYCPSCQAAANARAAARRARSAAGRGSATARGYGTVYQRRRAAIVARAQRDRAPCAICGRPCEPGQAIVAHHPDGNPASADPATCRLEPAHASCNSGFRR